jgi:hypothetical protein
MTVKTSLILLCAVALQANAQTFNTVHLGNQTQITNGIGGGELSFNNGQPVSQYASEFVWADASQGPQQMFAATFAKCREPGIRESDGKSAATDAQEPSQITSNIIRAHKAGNFVAGRNARVNHAFARN